MNLQKSSEIEFLHYSFEFYSLSSYWFALVPRIAQNSFEKQQLGCHRFSKEFRANLKNVTTKRKGESHLQGFSFKQIRTYEKKLNNKEIV